MRGLEKAGEGDPCPRCEGLALTLVGEGLGALASHGQEEEEEKKKEILKNY